MDTPWTQKKRACEARKTFRRSLRALCDHRVKIPRSVCIALSGSVLVFVAVASGPALAQEPAAEAFTDIHDGGKLHAASGFVCPSKIGLFTRDAVGEIDPSTGADFCAYSALGGVYGTIKLTLLSAPYNPQVSLAPSFIEEEGTGGKRVAEGVTPLEVKSGAAPLALYTRGYETEKLGDDRFRVLFTGAQLGNWAVETTIEYVDPRDLAVEKDFLRAVYAGAEKEIAGK